MKFKNIPIPANIHKAIKAEAADKEIHMYSLIVSMFETYKLQQKSTQQLK